MANETFADFSALLAQRYDDGTALDAATFYPATLQDSAVGAVQRASIDFPSGKQGDAFTGKFTVLGFPCLSLNGLAVRRFRSRWRPRTSLKRTACGARSSTTAAKKAPAVGARTNGDCPDRSRHVH